MGPEQSNSSNAAPVHVGALNLNAKIVYGHFLTLCYWPDQTQTDQ